MEASSSSSYSSDCSLERPCSRVYCSCKPFPEQKTPIVTSGVPTVTSGALNALAAVPTASSSAPPPHLTLDDLPKDLLAHIMSRVAATGWKGGFFNAARVSAQFRRLSEERFVLRSASTLFMERKLWFNHPYRRRLFAICLASGHPHAQFLQGNADYFLNHRRVIGFRYLFLSASQGHLQAMYVCGIMLLCQGGLNRQMGLDILYSLMHPHSVNESMTIVGNLRRSTGFHFWRVGYGADTMRELRQGYVRDPCRCNGRTTNFVETSQWSRHGRDIPVSEACLICFWDHQVQRYFQGFND